MQPSPLTTPLTTLCPLKLTFIVVLALLSLATASAQDLDGASINGTIVDQNGAVDCGRLDHRNSQPNRRDPKSYSRRRWPLQHSST